jgi:hypothetical protein
MHLIHFCFLPLILPFSSLSLLLLPFFQGTGLAFSNVILSLCLSKQLERMTKKKKEEKRRITQMNLFKAMLGNN